MTPIELAAAAKAHRTTAAALRQAVALARSRAEAPAEAAEATAAPDAGEPPPHSGGQMTAEERQAAIDTFSALPKAERAARRGDTAIRLNMTRADLDKAVAAARTRRRAEADAEMRSRPDPAPGEVIWPPGIVPRPDGLYADAGEDAPPLRLAPPFEVLGHSRDASGRAWGLYLRWRDRDGCLQTHQMPARLTVAEPGALEAELADRGLQVSADPTARLRLRMALAEVRAGGRVRLAYRTGWQDEAGGAFLLPDGEVIGDTAEPVVLHTPGEDAARLSATAGTLEGWRAEVAAVAVGNPLAAFCLSAAFAGPLLLPLGLTGGGFHLTGNSKRGKTTAVQVGLSAWALPHKGAGLRDWNGTAGAFEAAAEDAGDMLLALDELHQANPAEVARVAYMLADGAGKGRLNRDASARRRRTWRTFILSTGEHDLATAAARGVQRLPAGADVRLPSLPVPDAAEGWPALHGRATLDALRTDLPPGRRAGAGAGACGAGLRRQRRGAGGGGAPGRIRSRDGRGGMSALLQPDAAEIGRAFRLLFRHAQPGLLGRAVVLQDRSRWHLPPEWLEAAPLPLLPLLATRLAGARQGCIAVPAAAFDAAGRPAQGLAITLDLDVCTRPGAWPGCARYSGRRRWWSAQVASPYSPGAKGRIGCWHTGASPGPPCLSSTRSWRSAPTSPRRTRAWAAGAWPPSAPMRGCRGRGTGGRSRTAWPASPRPTRRRR